MANPIKKIKRSFTSMSVKRSSSFEKSKLEMRMENLDADIERLILSIGEKSYENWVNGKDVTEGLMDAYESIKQKKAQIEELKREMEKIDERDSAILGVTVDDTKQTELTPEDTATVCPNCNARYEADVKFCRQCGTRLK